MSLKIFENIDGVLGAESVFGETFLSKDVKNIEKKTGTIKSGIDNFIGYLDGNGYNENSAGLLKEVHVYYEDDYLDSLYDQRLEYENDKFYFQPEKDLRLMGFEQGTYNMVYNTLYKFAGDILNPKMIIRNFFK